MILGLHIGHDATACLVGDDISALAEERITRKKNFHGFPFEAIAMLLDYKNITFKDINKIVNTYRERKMEDKYAISIR